MTSESAQPQQCSHVGTCELFPKFRSATLGVWQTFYCSGNFASCERFKLALAGKPVPPNLLPNGKTLDLKILGGKR